MAVTWWRVCWAELMMQRDGKYLRTLRLWIFVHDGVTVKAAELIRKHGILWSSIAELDGLLKDVGLRKLPELEEDSGVMNMLSMLPEN